MIYHEIKLEALLILIVQSFDPNVPLKTWRKVGISIDDYLIKYAFADYFMSMMVPLKTWLKVGALVDYYLIKFAFAD